VACPFSVAVADEMWFILPMNGSFDAMGDGAQRSDDSGLNVTAAVIVVLAVAFGVVCAVKDGNIVRAMGQAETFSVDKWFEYQAKSTRQSIAEATVDHLTAQRDATPGLSPESRGGLDRRIAEHAGRAKQYDSEKGDIKKKADDYQREYDRLKYRDGQLDAAEVCLAVCVALMGITALVQKRWLLALGVFFAVIGVMLGLGGFLGYKFHPEMLARFLG
jgi:hypothetical protein